MKGSGKDLLSGASRGNFQRTIDGNEPVDAPHGNFQHTVDGNERVQHRNMIGCGSQGEVHTVRYLSSNNQLTLGR